MANSNPNQENLFRPPKKGDERMTGQLSLKVPADLLEKIKAIPDWTDKAREVLIEWIEQEQKRSSS